MPPSTPLKLLTTGALALTLGLAACGDDDAPADTSAGSETETETVDESDGASDDGAAVAGDAVEILDFTFVQESITVDVGTEVTFTNMDGAAHTATARDGSFNTEEIAGGAEGSVTLDAPGEFVYFCAFHPFMEGTIVVE